MKYSMTYYCNVYNGQSGMNLNLASFLIMPVQRLPRYEMLLKELLKYACVISNDNYD